MATPVTSPPAPWCPDAPKRSGFKAYEIDTSVNPVPAYNRRDYYKVSLITGHCVVHYAEGYLELNGTYLFFANPRIPYSTVILSPSFTGYACLFTEEFVKGGEESVAFDRLLHCPLFELGGTPTCRLTTEQAAASTDIFQKLLAAQSTSYPFKQELIRSYLQLLIHDGLRLRHWESLFFPQSPADGNPPMFLG